MRKKLFLLGFLSFLYVNAQVIQLVDLSIPGFIERDEVISLSKQETKKAATAFVPLNDDCSSAIALTVNTGYSCSAVTAGSLFEATDSGLDTEVGTADDDVWYTFIATASTHVVSMEDVEGEVTTDLVFEIFSGTCEDVLTSIEASDNDTSVVGNLTPGTTYYLRVYSYGSDNAADTTFNVCVATLPPGPANDECEAAVALTVNPDYSCGVVTAGTLAFATDSGYEEEIGNADDDVWYTFTATSESHKISLLNIEGDEQDLAIEVFEGECGGVLVDYSDPDSVTIGELTAGTVYYVRVYSYYSDIVDTTFDICIGTTPTSQPNDDCEGAISLTVNNDLSCGVTTTASLAAATDSGIAANFDEGNGVADDDVWFVFTASNEKHTVSLPTIENYEYLIVEVFEGECGTLNYLNGDDETLYLTGLTIGQQYYVRVYSYYDDILDINFEICIGTPPPPPVNDECEGAIALTVNNDLACGVVTAATIVSATDSGVEEGEFGTPDDDVWFTLVATAETHKISLLNIEGDNEDMVIEILDGECGSLNFIEATDPESFTVDGLTVGQTYYVRMFSYSDGPTTTTFDVCVGTIPPPTANDECDGAIALTVDAAFCNGANNNGDNSGATDSGIGLAECFSYGENDVWFTFTVPTGVATVDISTDFTGGTLVDTEIALYSGDCGDLTEIDCDQDGGETELSNGNDYNSIIEDVEVNVGETYYVRVAGYSSDDAGTFCLEISTNETLSAEDFNKNGLKVYPNPVKDILTLSDTENITNVAVFNLLGQEVVSKTINATQSQIDMSDLASGSYLVKITADNQVKTVKVIKK